MKILSELNSIFSEMRIPCETGVYSGVPPDEYVVVEAAQRVPLLHADNHPLYEEITARISLFSNGNYVKTEREIVGKLIECGFDVKSREYIGHNDENGYFYTAVDAAKIYDYEVEELTNGDNWS